MKIDGLHYMWKPGRCFSKSIRSFSGKSYNLQSLTVGTTEDETVSRMTICVTSDDITFEQIKTVEQHG